MTQHRRPGRPPKVTWRKTEPLLEVYHDRHGNQYNVARLIEECKDLVPFKCPIASLPLGDKIWQDCTILELARHCEKVNKADLDYPIIIDWNGDIADGRHRVMKAIMQGKRTILAVKMYWKAEPDRPATT